MNRDYSPEKLPFLTHRAQRKSLSPFRAADNARIFYPQLNCMSLKQFNQRNQLVCLKSSLKNKKLRVEDICKAPRYAAKPRDLKKDKKLFINNFSVISLQSSLKKINFSQFNRKRTNITRIPQVIFDENE